MEDQIDEKTGEHTLKRSSIGDAFSPFQVEAALKAEGKGLLKSVSGRPETCSLTSLCREVLSTMEHNNALSLLRPLPPLHRARTRTSLRCRSLTSPKR